LKCHRNDFSSKGTAFMSAFSQDFRYGFRSLLKNRGFAAVAVLTLALGVGANTAIFSVLRAVVLRDLAYSEPDRIAVMWTKNIRQNLPDGSSYLNFRDWKESSKQFSDMAAYIRPEFTRGTLAEGTDAVRIHVGAVGPGFFELLGTPPLIGRTFKPEEFGQNVTSVVISHSLWRQRFGGDANVVGKTVQFNNSKVEIIGVMPLEFQLPTPEVQLWQPLWFGSPNWTDERSRSADALIVLGRLSAGATIESARAEMDAIAARLREQYPRSNAAFGVTTDLLVERVIGPTTERSLWLLFGSVGFVLLIACANVANLVLARAAGRRNEFSLRTALGASKTRLVFQALAENLLIALLAAVVGVLFAWIGAAALRNWSTSALPRAESIQVDAGVLFFALAASVGCALIAGIIPALQLSVSRPAEALREAGPRASGGRGSRFLHQALVVSEIGLAVILLSGAGLLLRSFQRVQAANRGFDSTNVLLLQVDLPPTYNNRSKIASFYTEALQRVRSLPGVVAAGAISDFFIHRQPDYRIALEGQPPARPEDPAPPLTEDQIVPGYFEAMRIPLIRGRLLQETDAADGAAQVVVINEEMARKYWPGQDALGKRFKYGLDPAADMPWKTVVGVVSDMRRQKLDEAAIPYMFQPGFNPQMDIAIRTAADPESLLDAVRDEIRSLDPLAPPYGVMTVESRFAQTVALRRLRTMLLAMLAGVALVLSMIGAYGVIHRSVASRTQEIGIRMALGASAPTILTMVLKGGLVPAGIGLALGLVGSFALSRTLSSFLYETSAVDPITYVVVSFLLIAVTIGACLAPARRASKVDPISALREF
jgi:putative ABC transport system permease protein